jgi:signal transduction histidine kinase
VRLERRLARERAARLEAEAIAERVTSDRWDLRQQLEEKLALRTSELEAARRTAAEAVTGQERFTSAISHDLRTALGALFFLADSLSPGEPPSAKQLEQLKSLLSDMRTVLDSRLSPATGADAGTGSGEDADTGSTSAMTLAAAAAAHEGHWHQVAARSGKLLMLDIENPSGQLPVGTESQVNEVVLSVLRNRLDSSEPVIELHLRIGAGGVEVS